MEGVPSGGVAGGVDEMVVPVLESFGWNGKKLVICAVSILIWMVGATWAYSRSGGSKGHLAEGGDVAMKASSGGDRGGSDGRVVRGRE